MSMQATCDQFVYTAAKIGSREGYQVIAKSSGITDQIVTSMMSYLYPLGVKVSEFSESRSLITLANKKLVAYSIIKNIGIGYDGRRGTLYNHTFVMDADQFRGIGCDSRLFDRHYKEDGELRGTLPKIQIESGYVEPDFGKLDSVGKEILEEILYRIIKKTKLAIVRDHYGDVEFIQNLLAVLPPHQRLVPFSTLVVEPDRQYGYKLIQIQRESTGKLGKKFAVVGENLEIKNRPASRNTLEFKGANILSEIIRTRNTEKLLRIFGDIQNISDELAAVRQIRVKDIFSESEFKKSLKSKEYESIKNKTTKLYSSDRFNDAPPRVILSITKKIRTIAVTGLKGEKSTTGELLEIVRVLLDRVNYMENYSNKKMRGSLKEKFANERLDLEEILREYAPVQESSPYAFDIVGYGCRLVKRWKESVEAFTLLFGGKN